VQLLHEGGLAGGSPAAHASAVTDALVKSTNSFVSQIRAANKSVGGLHRLNQGFQESISSSSS
jgi:hypothetical protein